MANLGSITLNDIQIFEINSDPSIDGLTAPTGSLAILTDGSKMFLKNGEGDMDWESVSPNPKYTYKTTGDSTIESLNYTQVPDLSSEILPIGLYKFEFNCKVSSIQGADDVRLRLSPSIDSLESKYAQGSILTLENSNECIVSGYGVFRISVPLSISIEIKSAIDNNTITIKPDSLFIIEPL